MALQEGLLAPVDGPGRAYALLGDAAKAKAAYQDFLTLSKRAAAGLPILVRAKAEYSKLHSLSRNSTADTCRLPASQAFASTPVLA